MSAVQYHMPPNTLRRALEMARPKLAQAAIAKAEANLTSLSSQCLEHVDGLLDALDAISAPNGDRWGESAIEEAYALALRFIGPSSLAGLPDLERAARSLCDLADVLGGLGRNDRQPVRVHVEAMRLLRFPEAIGSKEELFAGLDQVLRRYTHEPAASVGGARAAG